jgi:conjugal transfer/entry exclusion protein
MDNEVKDQVEQEVETNEVISLQEQIFKLEVRMQEIDAIIEKYEDDFYNKTDEV